MKHLLARSVVLSVYCLLMALSDSLDEKEAKLPTKCHVCKHLAREIRDELAESGKTHDVLQIGQPFQGGVKKIPYRQSETRLTEAIENACSNVLDYKVHKDKPDALRYEKVESVTFNTLRGLKKRGVKVELGFPDEMWDSPDAEVTRLKNRCEFMVEKYEDDLIDWYWKHQQENLTNWLCVERVLDPDEDECLNETKAWEEVREKERKDAEKDKKMKEKEKKEEKEKESKSDGNEKGKRKKEKNTEKQNKPDSKKKGKKKEKEEDETEEEIDKKKKKKKNKKSKSKKNKPLKNKRDQDRYKDEDDSDKIQRLIREQAEEQARGHYRGSGRERGGDRRGRKRVSSLNERKRRKLRRRLLDADEDDSFRLRREIRRIRQTELNEDEIGYIREPWEDDLGDHIPEDIRRDMRQRRYERLDDPEDLRRELQILAMDNMDNFENPDNFRFQEMRRSLVDESEDISDLKELRERIKDLEALSVIFQPGKGIDDSDDDYMRRRHYRYHDDRYHDDEDDYLPERSHHRYRDEF